LVADVIALKLITNAMALNLSYQQGKCQITNYKSQITNHKLQITNHYWMTGICELVFGASGI
jgi:hypothetical protein